jgi:hypothetical protein
MFDDPVKIGAIAVAAGVILWPYLGKAQEHLHAILASLRPFPTPKTGIDAQDLATVLDLATRLKNDGNEKASGLAKQLLDAMLEVTT